MSFLFQLFGESSYFYSRWEKLPKVAQKCWGTWMVGSRANSEPGGYARVCNYMDTKKRRVLMNAFITPQFSYCPLVRIFHSRTLNNRINKIHEKALRFVYKNETFLSFDDVLKRDKSVSVHQKNLQILATEIYKTKKDLGPKIMNDTFRFIQKPYNLRNDPELQKRNRKFGNFGTSEQKAYLRLPPKYGN